MYTYPPFDPKEWEVTGTHKCGGAGMLRNLGMDVPEMEVLQNTPITPRENLQRMFRGENHCWIPHTGWVYCDVNNFRPRLIPDNVATHLVFDAEPDIPYETDTMTGWFNLDWVYVPIAGGATVKPGEPLIDDMNDWEEKILWPDLDALDWEAMGKANAEFLQTTQFNQLGILDGFWERLISLMDVSGAAMALIDEDQEEALHAFFDKYADFLIDYIRHVKAVCPIDGVLIHDDWGTQNGPFFSLDTAMEMLVPYLKRVVDYIHSEGMYYEQHSCGNCTKLVPAYIAAGVDLWTPQTMNDIDGILDVIEGSRMHLAMPDACPPDASEEVAVQLAREWFAKYGKRQVTLAPMAAPAAFLNEIYRLSREEFAK